MKPTATESLRGIQAALLESIVPELPSLFAQDTAQTIQMLIESIAGEIDTAADDLCADNAELCGILSQARDALAGRNGEARSLVKEIDGVLGEAGERSLRLSALTARNNQLRGALEKLLVYVEDVAGEDTPVGAQHLAPSDALLSVRRVAYAHLRQACVRGWSFWDLMSFRERMARAREETLPTSR